MLIENSRRSLKFVEILVSEEEEENEEESSHIKAKTKKSFNDQKFAKIWLDGPLKAMRVKEMITHYKNSWLLNKFSILLSTFGNV